MRLFSPLYRRVMQWSRHDKAPWFLGGLSFAESSFFPIPPDVMLAPMSMAKPTSAIWFATLTTITSVLGGMAGYLIGVFAFDMIQPMIAESARYSAAYESATQWFADYGVWAILIAGFSPIPYKIFTITAGVVGMAFLPFVIASVIGRGARFYLVALLMAWGGPAMEEKLNRWVDGLGWTVVVLVIAAIVYLRG